MAEWRSARQSLFTVKNSPDVKHLNLSNFQNIGVWVHMELDKENSGLNIPAKDIFAEMNHMATGIAIYSDELSLLFANKTIRNYLPDLYAALDTGMTMEEGVIAQMNVMYPDMSDIVLEERAQAICNHIRNGGTLEVNTPSGIKLSSACHKTSRGTFIVTTQDITKRVEYEQELAEARRKAEEANNAKTEYLADMSHEIRTPLSGVFMSAQLLQQQLQLLGHSELNSLSDILVSSASHLSAIINDVLDLSKIEAGQVEIKLSENSLIDTLGHLKNSQDHVADNLGIDLKLVIDPNLPETLVNSLKRAASQSPQSLTLRLSA